MIGTLCPLPFAMNNAVGTPTTLSPAAVRQGSLFKKEIEDTNLLAAEAGEGLDRVREGPIQCIVVRPALAGAARGHLDP